MEFVFTLCGAFNTLCIPAIWLMSVYSHSMCIVVALQVPENLSRQKKDRYHLNTAPDTLGTPCCFDSAGLHSVSYGRSLPMQGYLKPWERNFVANQGNNETGRFSPNWVKNVNGGSNCEVCLLSILLFRHDLIKHERKF